MGSGESAGRPPLRVNFYRQHCAKLKALVGLYIYSEADFEVFRPAGATRCTDGSDIWRGGWDSSTPDFNPSVQRLVYRTCTPFQSALAV